MSYEKLAKDAAVSQGMQDLMRSGPGWPLLKPAQKQALAVIVDQIALIVNNDSTRVSYDRDVEQWHEIAGYSRLIEAKLIESGTVENQFVDFKEQLRKLGMAA